MHCAAVQCSAMPCNALQCNAIQCSAVRCTALHCIALQCNALHCTTLLTRYSPWSAQLIVRSPMRDPPELRTVGSATDCTKPEAQFVTGSSTQVYEALGQYRQGLVQCWGRPRYKCGLWPCTVGSATDCTKACKWSPSALSTVGTR